MQQRHVAGAGCISCTLKAHCPGAVRECPPCSGQQGKCSARCCPCSHALVLQCCLLVVRIISWRMRDLLHSGLQPSDTARVARLRKQHVGPKSCADVCRAVAYSARGGTHHSVAAAEGLSSRRGNFPVAASAFWQRVFWRCVFVLQGATLWAADGTSYLDCVNNVAHVGHCNVKVSLCT